MTFDTTDIILNLVKIAIVLGVLLSVTPIMVWIERRGGALIQDRPGPNRVGPFGLLQSLADAVKLILKEDIIPAKAHRVLFTLAPTFGLIPALTVVAVIPWGKPFVIPEVMVLGRTLFEGGRLFEPIIANLNVGILLIFALSSLGVYGLVTAGWASNNKYALLGGIRASAQMISYELALALAVVGALLAAGSLNLMDVVAYQTGYYMLFGVIKLPAWNVFPMFLGFIVFLVSAFAETNRLPFDFPEAEAELVAGYHVEYSSAKFALFFMAEYMAMAVISALMVTLFLGGWDIPWYDVPANTFGFVLSALSFAIKTTAILFLFVWVRWTLPRLKYDSLMRIGWKVFIPLGLLNVFIVALLITVDWI
jgi:NADH-quinone oxidoreductase subunit H